MSVENDEKLLEIVKKVKEDDENWIKGENAWNEGRRISDKGDLFDVLGVKKEKPQTENVGRRLLKKHENKLPKHNFVDDGRTKGWYNPYKKNTSQYHKGQTGVMGGFSSKDDEGKISVFKKIKNHFNSRKWKKLR